MKLRYRRTILVGFAFLAICAFWQMYDNVIPLILTETFHLNETLSGAIMAADNVLALFLLPLFGALSDRTRTRFGKRMPYIFAGTILAVMLMNVLPVLDNAYFRTPTSGKLAAFVAVLGLLLVAMGLYRSPAVALMPDVTPKPLRSRGNAVINLMGALGGILYLLAANVLYSAEATEGLAHVDYQPLFLVVGGIMLLSLLIQVFTIREEPMAEDVRRWEAEHPEQEEADGAAGKGGFAALPREVRRSLFFLLLSIALWFIGYNGVTTWFTTYASQVWGMALGEASGCLMLATGGAIVSYLPVGAAAARVGRKRTIAFGVVLLAKNAHVHGLLMAALHRGDLRKTYQALTLGCPDPPEGIWDAPLGRVPGESLLRRVDPAGKTARTQYRVLETQGGLARLELHPLTGRTHQLRVHCAYAGCPILGDSQYGNSQAMTFGFSGQQLLAKALSLPHPLTGAAVTLTSRQSLPPLRKIQGKF